MNTNDSNKPSFFTSFSWWHLQTRPVVNIGTCAACGKCKNVCRVKALDLFPCIPPVEVPPKTGEPRIRAEINYSKCVHCYRCQSLCPKNAIETYKPWVMRILGL